MYTYAIVIINVGQVGSEAVECVFTVLADSQAAAFAIAKPQMDKDFPNETWDDTNHIITFVHAA